jgi:hypothetical protein
MALHLVHPNQVYRTNPDSRRRIQNQIDRCVYDDDVGGTSTECPVIASLLGCFRQRLDEGLNWWRWPA